MNFNWEEFKQVKFVVHCKTYEENMSFKEECAKQNINNAPAEFWDVFKKNTCYICVIGKNLGYHEYLYFQTQDYKIIEWCEYMEQEKEEEEFKVGDRFELEGKIIANHNKGEYQLLVNNFVFLISEEELFKLKKVKNRIEQQF